VKDDSHTLPREPALLAAALLARLSALANPANVDGMARYGISRVGTLGASMPQVRGLARDARRVLGKDADARHATALALWESGVHEARIMAAVLDDPALVTRAQAESWALDLDSWDTCDQLCNNLLWATPFAWDLPAEWAGRPETFVKRAGFVVITQLAVKDKGAPDGCFLPFLGLIVRECTDERNDVKKGVNWALRQIGKRSAGLHPLAIATGERILSVHADSAPARWIARDALRELRGPAVLERLGIATAPQA